MEVWAGIHERVDGDIPRKTAERKALELGENLRDLQHFMGQSPWQKKPALVIH